MRILTKAGFAVLAVSMTGTAIAQDSETLRACQAIENAAERLACFDAAMQNMDTPVADAPEAAELKPASESPSAQQAAAAPTATAATSDAPTRQLAEAPTAEPQPSGPPESRLLPSWFPNVNITFGTNRDPDEPDFFATEVTRIQRNNAGRHFFTTKEGHVWRQVQIEEVRAPDALPAPAEIKQGLIGNIRLELVGTGRSYSVIRVE